MAYGYIGQEKNFVYINGAPLLDVKSVDSSISTNRTAVSIAGIGAGPQLAEGVSTATLNISKHVISNTLYDPFANNLTYYGGFSGVWQHRDATGGNNFFAMTTGYVNSYNFTAAVNSIPSVSVGIVSYGSGIGQIDTPTGYMTGATSQQYLDNYIYPKTMELVFPKIPTNDDSLSGVVTTNRVQSFDISFTMNREVRNRLGQMKQIPETFISYPFEATLSIDIDVDEYSIPVIDSLICQDPETIQLTMKKCDGTIFRIFEFSSGTLRSASMNEEVREINRATLEYTRYISRDDEIDFWVPVE
jgi:hypothetical protein